MKPLRMTHTTRELNKPSGWDDDAIGATCESLPVTDVDGAMISYWRGGWRDRVRFVLGKPIRVSVLAASHPPIMVDTDD